MAYQQLIECKTGCMIGNTLVNHFMYADDQVGFNSSLISVLTGVDFDIKYNAKKSIVLICRKKDDMELKFLAFYSSGQTMRVSKNTKCLGHIIPETLEDDDI